MTQKQIEMLDLIKTVGLRGVCINYAWKWVRCDTGHAVHISTIRALEAKGLVDIMYFSGGDAAINLTAKGRGE